MKNSRFLLGFTFLALAQAMVGINIVISKILLANMPVSVLLALRFILATIVLFLLHLTTKARNLSFNQHLSTLEKRDWVFIIGQALSAGVLFNCLMSTGLNYTDANVAGIITSALPAIIALMSWFILGEKISAQKALCIFFATIGLIIIAFDKLKSIGLSHSFLGDFVVFLSLLPEATYYILCKVYSNKLPIFLTSSILNGINALILIPALFLVNWEPASITVASWLLLVIIGLSSGLFYVCWFIGAQRVEGVLASLSTAIMPVATVIFAWLILSERLSSLEFLGMGLVIFSIILYAKR